MNQEAVPVSNPEPTRWMLVKRKTKRILRWIVFLFIIILFIIFYLRYVHTYSEGSRSGLLQKFSKTGFIFKTYEGELILNNISGRADMVIVTDRFQFSVIDEKTALALDSLQGEKVTVYYKQKRAPLVWRGNTPFYVDSVRQR